MPVLRAFVLGSQFQNAFEQSDQTHLRIAGDLEGEGQDHQPHPAAHSLCTGPGKGEKSHGRNLGCLRRVGGLLFKKADHYGNTPGTRDGYFDAPCEVRGGWRGDDAAKPAKPVLPDHGLNLCQPQTMKISAAPSTLHHDSSSRRWRWTAAIAVSLVVLTVGISGCMISQPLTGFAHTAIPDLSASPERLRNHVRTLSEDFLGRGFEQPQTLQRAADYIAAELAQSGVMAERQRFEVGGQSYENLIARFGEAEGDKPLLVMGAHYDSALTHEGVSTPGADDNASGVAGLLELARLLANKAPSQPVELVFYTLEEPPNFRTDDMGSYRHALSLQQRKQPVRLMLSIEMIGYYSDAPGSQTYPLAPLGWIYPDKGNFISLIGEMKNFAAMRSTKAVMRAAGGGSTPLGVQSLNAPRFVHGVDFSDHLNYWRLGYPAIMVTDTSFMRNPHYHQRTDTWERLDYTRMAQVVRMLAAVALATP